MKVLLFISTLFLIVSCGKYDKPFITFKSPEKRLMNHTWRCVKAVDSTGNEFEVYDHITFEINGSDSVFIRQTDFFALKPSNIVPQNENNISIDSVTGIATITGNWTWAYAHKDRKNKQMIKLKMLAHFDRNNWISILSNKEFVYQDQTFDNTTYHYKKL
ncbi:hypothetical protein N8927_01605 [Crocinitomicaceae bacterium]|nr:hypothetical protein [Crocinitomicaceae bacterium]